MDYIKKYFSLHDSSGLDFCSNSVEQSCLQPFSSDYYTPYRKGFIDDLSFINGRGDFFLLRSGFKKFSSCFENEHIKKTLILSRKFLPLLKNYSLIKSNWFYDIVVKDVVNETNIFKGIAFYGLRYNCGDCPIEKICFLIKKKYSKQFGKKVSVLYAKNLSHLFDMQKVKGISCNHVQLLSPLVCQNYMFVNLSDLDLIADDFFTHAILSNGGKIAHQAGVTSGRDFYELSPFHGIEISRAEKFHGKGWGI
jgi:hypothetical protein